MSLVLHVGAHKTGTSLIQKYFRDRVEDFDPSAVVAVSRSDTNRLIGWGEVVQKRPLRLRRRVAAELQTGTDVVLVSHENSLGQPMVPGEPGLYPNAAATASALAASTDGFDVSVVFYVRPVADFVESYYLQTIHEGAWHSFDDWYSGLEPSTLSWTPVVEALERAFGADRTLIGDFNEVKAGQNEFLERFMRRAGIRPPSRVRYKPRRNASISATGLEIARNVNPHLENKQQRVATRKFLPEHFSNIGGERARPMPAEVRADLERRYGAEYEQLAERARSNVGSSSGRK